MTRRYILLDFDGTLTAPEHITPAFLADYRMELLAAIGEGHAALWDRTLAAVRAGSPELAWTLDGYEACPIAADPYILASAVATRVLASVDRGEDLRALPNELYARLYMRHRAPFRPEVVDVLAALHATGATLAVVSNASTGKIEGRLDELLRDTPIRRALSVYGGARKFSIRPATRETPARAAFDALPDFVPSPASDGALRRPTWLRRGAFFDALADVWGADAAGPAKTVFCGDIWELDLALPAALGCDVHLVERAAPLATHDAERTAVTMAPRASISADLWGLVERVR
ncbi:MAG: HAD family hydrolase [Pseudomonadota bacterium]|nr:HAD family hydrolase [Pseudomonadota bacterium]